MFDILIMQGFIMIDINNRSKWDTWSEYIANMIIISNFNKDLCIPLFPNLCNLLQKRVIVAAIAYLLRYILCITDWSDYYASNNQTAYTESNVVILNQM